MRTAIRLLPMSLFGKRAGWRTLMILGLFSHFCLAAASSLQSLPSKAQAKAILRDCAKFSDLNACYAALPESGGIMRLAGHVVVTLHRPLVIRKPHVTLEGAGANSIIRRGPALSGELLVLNSVGDTIRNLAVDGNASANRRNAFAELALHGPETLAEGVIVRNANAIAIAAFGAKARVTHSVIEGIGSAGHQTYGIWAINRATGVRIDHNRITSSGIDGIGADGSDLIISDNYLAQNHCYRGIGGGQIVLYNDPKHAEISEHITIARNTIDAGCGPTSSGLELSGYDMRVEGNVIRRQKFYGIVLEEGGGFQLRGNVVGVTHETAGGTTLLVRREMTGKACGIDNKVGDLAEMARWLLLSTCALDVSPSSLHSKQYQPP